ncbi:hypothetical protein T484DRAFT_1842198 [Baffinella frigidus]|nr:hypothetical protein T484DRAFT_1842198 [Cryptophyta sp. CCMP2293]
MAWLTFRMAAVALLVGLAAVAGETTVSTSSPCFKDPSDDACADGSSFFPDATVSANMKSLCDRKPFLSGCSILASCTASTLTGKYCMPWSLAASICSAADLATTNEAECVDYIALCRPASVTTKVKQCAEYPMVPNLPSTEVAFNTTVALCGVHEMMECSACTGTKLAAATCPDPFATTAKICVAMPAMKKCDGWWSVICNGTAATDLKVYCTASVSASARLAPSYLAAVLIALVSAYAARS